MKLNKTIESKLNKIPDDIKEKYNIDNYTSFNNNKTGILIHHPAVINIMFDRKFNVEITKHTIDISNKTMCVCLWIDTFKMHTTIYT